MCGFQLWVGHASRSFSLEHGCRDFQSAELKLGIEKAGRLFDEWLEKNRSQTPQES